jgi:hypothetical protein
MLTIELPEGYLNKHEQIALEHGGLSDENNYILPVTVAEEGGRIKLLYRTDGYITFAEYNFHGDLYRMFRAIKGYVRKIYEAQDMLLRPDRIFRSADSVFVSTIDCNVRIVYGGQSAPHSASGAYNDALMPLLADLSEKKGITGAKPAMVQLAKKIRSVNPDYETALHIIESVERQWNYMQPVGV